MAKAVLKSRTVAPVSSLSLAKAKATLSAVVDGVEQKRVPVTILRRGIPVVQIIPFPQTPAPKLRGSMAGTVRILGDIVSPLGVEWTLSDDE
jgi:prevent-host-death family protein